MASTKHWGKYKPAQVEVIKEIKEQAQIAIFFQTNHCHSSILHILNLCTTMKSAAILLIPLVTMVAGHGYLWQPESRTKLGFKVRYIQS